MNGQERIQFISLATSALKHYQFTLTYKNKNELDNVYSLALRIKQFREDCQRYDIHDVFEILPPFIDEHGQVKSTSSTMTPMIPMTPITPSTSNDATTISSSGDDETTATSTTKTTTAKTHPNPKNLFDNYKDISLDDVKKSTRMYYEHGLHNYLVENVIWSGEKLLNSCDGELRDMILSKALFLPQKEVGGPVYFKIMMDIYSEINTTPPSPPSSPNSKRIELKQLGLSLSNLRK